MRPAASTLRRQQFIVRAQRQQPRLHRLVGDVMPGFYLGKSSADRLRLALLCLISVFGHRVL